jgi:hypothetical protein
LANFLQLAAHLAIQRGPSENEVEACQNDGQNVVEVMCDAAGEAAQRLETLGSCEIGLRFAQRPLRA